MLVSVVQQIMIITSDLRSTLVDLNFLAGT